METEMRTRLHLIGLIAFAAALIFGSSYLLLSLDRVAHAIATHTERTK
jgi:hypothetical protein